MAKKFTKGAKTKSKRTPTEWAIYNCNQMIDVEYTKADLILSVLWAEAQRQAQGDLELADEIYAALLEDFDIEG